MVKFKTLINNKGDYMHIIESHNKYAKSKFNLAKVSVPYLMGMKVTTESYEKCYGKYVDFTDLEVITVNLDKV